MQDFLTLKFPQVLFIQYFSEVMALLQLAATMMLDSATFHSSNLASTMLAICSLIRAWFCKSASLVKVMWCLCFVHLCLEMKSFAWMHNHLIWLGSFTRALRVNWAWPSKVFKWSYQMDSCWPKFAMQTRWPQWQIPCSCDSATTQLWCFVATPLVLMYFKFQRLAQPESHKCPTSNSIWRKQKNYSTFMCWMFMWF